MTADVTFHKLWTAPADETIVAITDYQGVLVIATDSGVYTLDRQERGDLPGPPPKKGSRRNDQTPIR